MKTVEEAALGYANKTDRANAEWVATDFKAGVEFAQRWIPVEDELPPACEEVLFFNSKWINEEYNPKGIRIGFMDEKKDFTTAHWWSYQDCYMTISHAECDASDTFSEEIKSSIEPTHWRHINLK